MVIIVGHGKSLFGAGRGRELDMFPVVIQMPFDGQYSGVTTADFGKRATYYVEGVHNHNAFINQKLIPEHYSWLYTRPGALTAEKEKEIELRLSDYYPVICHEADYWLEWFIENGARALYGRKPIPSNGTVAAILAIERLKPKKVVLAGCDHYWDKDTDHYGYHDTIVERELLKTLSQKYKVKVEKF